ncbi:MAG: ABC transporter ATP-binding protein [Candidatus Ozemobacteraceae bacterium]
MSSSYFQEDEIVGKVYDHRLIRRLIPWLRPYLAWLTLAVVFVLTGMSLFLVNPYILGRIVDQGIRPRNVEVINSLACTYLAIEVLVYAAACLQNYLLQYVGQKVMFDLRSDVFSHIQYLSAAFFDRNPVGRLVTRATNDVSALAELFSSGIVVVLGDVVLIFGIAAALFGLQPRLAAATLSTIPLLILFAWYFQRRMRDAFRDVRFRIARVNAMLSESISGVKIVQIFHREADRAMRFREFNAAHRDAQLASLFNHAMFLPVVTVINAVTIIIVLLIGGPMVERGELSLGILVSFLAYAQHFFFPIRDITEKISIFQSAMASAERILGLLDEPLEIDAKPRSASSPEKASEEDGVPLSERFNGNVEFERVTFGYVPGRPVLREVTFSLKAGQSAAIVGHTGAGKTTIASLLNRLYEIDAGRILIDGYDIRKLPKSWLRRQVAVLQQDVFIFSGNALENVRLRDLSISRERVEEVCRDVGVDGFIRELPDGYQGEIFERGANLSIGQRQLLAFARAMSFDPRILVLDEATSSIDSETEKLVQKAIKTMTCGRTCLIIAHRLSTIRHCDVILVLHHGILVEQGTHDELIARRGTYHMLYEMQFKDESAN